MTLPTLSRIPWGLKVMTVAAGFAVAGGIYGIGELIWAIPSARAFVLRTEPLRVSSASPLQSLSQGDAR